MPVPDFAHGVTSSDYWFAHLKSLSAQPKTAAAKPDDAKPATATAGNDSGSSFFDDLLDVVNPLQHLPVVGTVYRAVTGDKIGDVEKVAGDTLYGGPIGLVSSLADLAFEKITGKDFGSTVMAFVGLDHDDSTTALAANTPKPEPAKSTASKEATAAPTQLASAIKPLIVPAASPAVTSPSPSKPTIPQAAPTATSAQASVVDISTNTDALLQALARNGVTGDMQTQALDAYKRTMSLNSASITPTVH